MVVFVDNEITILNPTIEVRRWVKENLEFPNPDYSKKRRMGFWVGDTPKKIILYKQRGDELILPYGTLKTIKSMVGKNPVIDLFKIPSEVEYRCSIPLRSYQVVAVQEMINSGGGILKSKAGSGKTQMGIALVAALGRKALWITHTKDLLNQSKTRAEQYIDKSLIGTITEGKVNIGTGITFATVQTLSNINLPLFKNEWDCIIVDECHRVAGSTTSVTMFSKVLENLAARHKYGLSATVHRSDGLIKTTYALLGDVSYVVPDEDVEKYTTNAKIRTISTNVKMSTECMNTDGTLNYSKMINYLCSNSERNKLIVNDLIENQEHYNLILSDRLEHLQTIISMLPSYLQKLVVYVDGKQSKVSREKAIEEMQNGNKRYLFASYKLAKEGLDIPRLDRLYLTTPQKDYAVITQAVGRIERVHENKTDAICYDYVDNIPFLIKSYKRRCSIYRKNGCEIE